MCLPSNSSTQFGTLAFGTTLDLLFRILEGIDYCNHSAHTFVLVLWHFFYIRLKKKETPCLYTSKFRLFNNSSDFFNKSNCTRCIYCSGYLQSISLTCSGWPAHADVYVS